jgi:glycosyltransferase involved in cell wall biosynthesis
MTSLALDTSVVICTYTEERWRHLVAAVESVQQQRLVPREIIVVIDHNPHLLARVQAELPGVIAVENTEPCGLSGARNSGVAAAQGTLIAFLDDDAVAAASWLDLLRQPCTDPCVLGTGGWVNPWWLEGRPGWFPDEFLWVVGCSYRGLPQTVTAVRNTFGGCTCIRREVFAVIGGFLHGVGRIGTQAVGCEETELCIRAQQHWPDRVWLFEPRAQIDHCVPATRAQWHYFQSRCFAEGVSKAAVVRRVGVDNGLATERRYLFHTLPIGILRGLCDTFRGDFNGLARASVIIAGLFITTCGYMIGIIRQCSVPNQA